MSWKMCPRCNLNCIKNEEELCSNCKPLFRPCIEHTIVVPIDEVEDKDFDLAEIEQKVLAGLKDFQRATVERITELFEEGIKRVLVADEVGLGKTLVARGVIAKAAKTMRSSGRDLFNVVYVCSNSSISGQNVEKLRINAETQNNTDDTRLSMQHLLIAEKENEAKEKNVYVRLIPVTPATSFQMKNGAGTAMERALMFVILKRIPEFGEHVNDIRDFLQLNVSRNAWDWWIDKNFEKRVISCDKKSQDKYLKNITQKISVELRKNNFLNEFIDSLKSNKECEQRSLINKLRKIFASVSVELLKADLVIMDEFQRFKSLLSYEQGTEAEMICRKIFGNNTQILLLSATPYKLYSTLDEIEETKTDEHYSEFIHVLKFLFDDSNEKMIEFETIWAGYTATIKEFSKDKMAVISVEKKKAESALFSHIARTERDCENNAIDASAVQPIEITPNDISTYIEMTRAFESVGLKEKIYEEYVKSCPYPLSFMREYKLKKNFEAACKSRSDIVDGLEKHSHLLWLDDNTIRQYRKLDVPNARFIELEKKVFEQNTHNLLWVPPSKPYYKMQGVYSGTELFTKTLVFSAWEMVPRMISTLLSYEAERLIREGIKINDENGYFGKLDKKGGYKRQPNQLLTYRVQNGKPHSMSLFTIMYPSKFLADLYDPVEYLNNGIDDVNTILVKLKEKITYELPHLKEFETMNDIGYQWYYIAPMLLDYKYNQATLEEWLKNDITDSESDKTEIDEGSDESVDKSKKIHLEELRKLFGKVNKAALNLGKMPKDLVDVLANATLGSFAVCAMRTFKKPKYAFDIAEVLRKRFNLPEATTIVSKKAEQSETHWRLVLKYCTDGNLQAVFDEYFHVLYDTVGKTGNVIEGIFKKMQKSFALHSSTPRIDTFENFKARMTQAEECDQMALRTHFAVSFSKDADDQKHTDRKNSLRNAFNSPMWPFVLATTSIGQEGLDFHNYCRRIVHWNLPANPIDIEQREGRINRYKCLAVRQSIVQNYQGMQFSKSVWEEMFEAAIKQKPETFSDLFPFWQLGEKQSIKIERIVLLFPLSKDILKYDRLVKILSLYRLSLGQPRQEEFIDSILKEKIPQDELTRLFINLSPFFHNIEKDKNKEKL